MDIECCRSLVAYLGSSSRAENDLLLSNTPTITSQMK
jgi:hypothetical protein